MLAGVLLRNYKNYNNINFIPICDNVEYQFSTYIGNNGAGKSAVLESIDVFFNGREWNLNRGSKGTEAYICPVFLIEKRKLASDRINSVFRLISEYFWNIDDTKNSTFKSNSELKKWLDYKNNLKQKYYDDFYFIMIGSKYMSTKAYFATLDEDIKKSLKKSSLLKEKNEDELDKCLNDVMQRIKDLYSYIYIPVEATPQELLQLQNQTMQKLLNKDLLKEIENILLKKNDKSDSILTQINESLNSFMDEVNTVIGQVEKTYEFKSTENFKKNLSAKDIREKVLEAYFPLRDLKVNGLPVSQLSSGEQRKAIIDVAYSVIVSNGEKPTSKEIILGIDEPESSLHVSNCFKHFQMLEKLAFEYSKQVLITTHWYGFLPVAHDGNLHYIENDGQGKRDICSFNLFSIMERQREFPDSIELKSMFDLATSIITYMRTDADTSWIICEGSDDKLYLNCVLDGKDNINVLPMGGCGNVVKLFRIVYSSLTEKNATNGNALFLIDTDKKIAPSAETMAFSSCSANIKLRRLQIDNGIPKLLEPSKAGGTYEQTEIEDCLDPILYKNALTNVIKEKGDETLLKVIEGFDIKEGAQTSLLRSDESCLDPKTIEAHKEKKKIIEFAEDDENKKLIAEEYSKLYDAAEVKPNHLLCNAILGELEKKRKVEKEVQSEVSDKADSDETINQVPKPRKKKTIIIINNSENSEEKK